MDEKWSTDKWNALLPYETDPPAEVFAEIKKNISQAVQQKDLTRGLKFWSDQLATYIKIYGYQIAKEDLITLIKMYYSLLVQEDINIPVVGTAGKTFTLLLSRQKVKKKITREDLILDWRPLYNIFKEIFIGKTRIYNRNFKVGYVQLEGTIRNVVSAARDFFSDEATQEMLDEWEPMICPPDSKTQSATTYISMFLPVTVTPEKGFRLWIDMVIGLMKTTTISFPTLLCRMAKYNVGKIDWKPHIPWMFNMTLHDLNLPVGESHTFAGGPFVSHKQSSTKMEIIVWMMGGECTEIVLDHLDSLSKTYHSFIHPSNRGKWTLKLMGFVNCLCQSFLRRIEMERHEQNIWFKQIPESHRISQENIDRFVGIMLPGVKLSMFNGNSSNFQHDYQCLVRLSPHVVLPLYLDHAFECIESIIEPQRVTTALCSFAVSLRALCLHEPSKQHVIPLLNSLLPTISSNDLTKSWIALLAFSFAFTMIPVVDCSHLLDQPGKRKKDLERVWRTTSQFKDMVAVFVDKLMNLIEVSAMEDTGNLNTINHKPRNTKNFKNASSIPDYLAEGSIYMSFDSLIRNSSDDIRDMILDKVFRYVTTTTLEVKIAGKTMGDALSNLSNTYTGKTLKKFMPHLISECNSLLNEENETGLSSAELLWNITMLRSILRGRGDCFLPYLGDIQDLLERCLNFHNSRQLVTIAVKAVSDMLYLLLKLKTLDFQSCQMSYNDKSFDFTSTWGVGVAADDLKLEWYVPGEAEYAAVNQIVERFGVSAMKKLSQFVTEKNTNKEEFQVQLRVLRAVQKTAGHIMPMFGTESPLKVPKYGGHEVDESVRVPIDNLNIKIGVECASEVLKTFRRSAAETVKTVYDYLIANAADDVKSFEIICCLFEDILTFKGYDGTKMKKEHTKYKSVKQMLDDKLAGKTKQLRMVVIHRVYLQQQYRQHAQLFSPYTEEHHKYTQCLVEMALSHYTIVRKQAQHCLKKCLTVMLNSRWFFIPQIIKYLEPNSEVPHEQLKGAIFSLCIPRISSYFAPQPLLYCDVFPAICKAQHSEKDSIINAIEQLADYIIDEYRTCTFNTTASVEATSFAEKLSGKLPSNRVQEGHAIAQLKDDLNKKSYNVCVDRLLDVLKLGSTTWRFLDLTGDILRTIIQHSTIFSASFVETFLGFLAHDSIGMRMISFRVVSNIIYLQRRVYKEMHIDPSTFPDDGPGHPVGERPSNQWLQYREAEIPDTEDKYKACIFVDKPHIGYNKWAKDVKVCIEIDYELDNTSRYSEIDKLVVSRFKDPAFVERFIELYSLEDNKGAEKTDIIRRHFYRDLFRNYGWSLFELFRPRMEEFVSGKIESQHRFAAEFLSAVTRGSKHWPFKDIEKMWDTILDLLSKAMNSVSSETLDMWVVCISSIVEDRDPRRFSRLLNEATKEFLSGRTIFHDTSNLYLLEIIVAQFEWKYAEGLNKLLDEIALNLNNNYKNVRDRLGQLIHRCLAHDTVMFNCRKTTSPHQSDFMAKVIPLLTSLDEGLFGTEWVVVNKLSLSDDNDAIKTAKTVASYLIYSRCFMHGHGQLVPEIFPFISYMLALEPNEVDPDLKALCTKALCVLSREILPDDSLGPAIHAIKKVVNSTSEDRTIGCSWKAKCTALVYLQVMTFCNIYKLRTNQEYISDIKALLLACLESPQVEVRQVAGQTIGGLMKTSLFKDVAVIVDKLKEMARTPLPKGTKKSQTDIKEIWVRHGAIKTLCSLVESFPYSVPVWLPQIIVFLASYTRGNVMIANDVKKCMSNFKRTHLDSWEEHKLKFTEDQLIVLQDLLVSPNYYA